MERKTGVVVPLGALYTASNQAVGDFPALKPFADFCKQSGFTVIQLLPVNDTGTQSSPYSGLSAFALHPIYIRLENLPEFEDILKRSRNFSSAYKSFNKTFKYKNRFDYEQISAEKIKLLHLYYTALEKKISPKKTKANPNPDTTLAPKFYEKLEKFTEENEWVISYAVFKNLKDDHFQASWKEWEEDKQKLNHKQIETRWNNKALKSAHNFFVWCQMCAAEQFKDAADYVRSCGIVLKGDIPILMNEDSVDCWAYPEYFNQELRAGSPPDGENPVGQNWGFPTYNWQNISADGYKWWKDRVKAASRYYSAFRIDHVLGFFRIWAVNSKETTAFLGHTVPFKTFTREDLHNAGFDDGRIRWLSEPHVPTSVVEDVTWDHEEAHAILQRICNRVGTEELWLFKEDIKTDGDIYKQFFAEDYTRDNNIKQALSNKWRDRAIIELSKDNFIPVWSYTGSTAWQSLNGEEKQSLEKLFAQNDKEQNELWKQQALDVLRPIVSETSMVPCAEDLGVNLQSLPEVLEELSILSLKVIRWNRIWEQNGQPYVPFAQYPERSVATTSVHDSSTLRQWWNEEKQSVQAYLDMCSANESDRSIKADDTFTSKVASFVLSSSAQCSSAWFLR